MSTNPRCLAAACCGFGCYPMLITACMLAGSPASLHSQPTGDHWSGQPPPHGVLGGILLTPADSTAQQLVQKLDFDGYKELIVGLAAFGDRRQGTARNAEAVAWIEDQLRSWGYETERHRYEFNGEPREQVYATKVGVSLPNEMYIVGAHMDGLGGGEAVNDNASGVAVVMEIARVLAPRQIEVARSVRFAFWNNEETGLYGSRAYVRDRAPLQGLEDPVGSGRYPEPRWVAMIQHDKVLFDHGNPVQEHQVKNADLDIEFQLGSEKWQESAELGLALLNANRIHATDYPAVLSNAMSATDSAPFMNHVAAVSVRENRRLYEIGRRSDPHWHQESDVFAQYDEADFRLGFNATQTTLGAIARLAEARLVGL